MSVSVPMPQLGESVTEGTVTRWLKHQGDHVKADEPLLEVSTDKVDTEIPAPVSGILTAIKVAEDETVAVGAPLAEIDTDGQSPPAQPKDSQQEERSQAAESLVESSAPADSAPADASSERDNFAMSSPAALPAEPVVEPAPITATYLTPLVRKLAAEHGVELSEVKGTGVGGRIRKQDVLDAARSIQAAPDATQPSPAKSATGADQPLPSVLRGRTEKMSRLRAVIAQRMVSSLQVSAQLTSVVEVDVTAIARLREQAKSDFERREGVKLSFLPFFALATVEALKQHPKLNALIDGEAGTITYHDAEHLGIAVDTERGLLVPVISRAGDLNLGGLARKIADLAERTRSGQVTPDELGGGTFTLTNTGSRGALFDTPIINQPQVAILGTGTVVKRPVVVTDPQLGEVISIRSMVYLALTYDHRLVDGADAARFLTTARNRLEEGRFEADLGL